MSTTAKTTTLEELRDFHLTPVFGQKPTAADVDNWEDEAAKGTSSIKTNAVPGGQLHGHLTYVIPEAEYQLQIEDEEWTFQEQAMPAAYPEVTGN